MKAKARFVAIFSRFNSGRSQAVRAAAPSALLPGQGSSAPSPRPSPRLRTSLLALGVAVFLLIPASPAFAEVIVTLAGSGAGTVTSNPAGINCANVGGGSPGPDCSNVFPLEEPPGEFLGVTLTATAAGDSYFAGWSGDDPYAGFLGPTCNEGDANPCTVIDTEEFGVPQIHITANFETKPDPPVTTTGASGMGANEGLITLTGTVNPSEFKVSSCHIEYGPTNDYGTKVPCVPAASALGEGSTDVPVSAEIETELLQPSTTYHYRLLASNPGGTGIGQDHTFTTAQAPPDHCLNAAIRDAQVFGAINLPECMALEMVSPPRKENQPAEAATVSANGERVRFSSLAALGGTPGSLSIGGDIYVASRGASGWRTTPTTPPPPLILGWKDTQGQSFTPDFSSWFHLAGSEAQVFRGIGQVFHAGLGGLFSPLSPLLMPPGGYGPEGVIRQSMLQGASADHSHLYFSAKTLRTGEKDPSYLPGDPVFVPKDADHNVYLAQLDSDGEPSLQLLTRDKTGKVWGGDCGARIGGLAASSSSEFHGQNGERNQGAISTDGSRTYFSTRPAQAVIGDCDYANKMRILKRTETSTGPEISELFSSECTRVSPPCSNADGDDFYQGASVDGTKVYFTTNRQLADTDLDGNSAECSVEAPVAGCDLYLYDSTQPTGERLTQISAGDGTGLTPGEGADLYDGIAAISGDGSHVYFVATGVLTTIPNAEGQSAQAGQPNLYLYERNGAHPTGHTAFLGTLATQDDLWGQGGHTYPVPVMGKDAEAHEVGGDGHLFFFDTSAALSSADADGTHVDVYRYDAQSEALWCVSCAPGGPDSAGFDASGGTGPDGLGTEFAEEGRQVSEDGKTVVFMTDAPLLPDDKNAVIDSYLWRNGQLTRLPAAANGPLRPPALSHDGSTVAFQSFKQLLPQDGDTALDVYVARVEGGYPVAVPSVSCRGEACQEPFAASPGDQGPASDAALSGNPASQTKPTRHCPKGKRKVRRQGKPRCVKQTRRATRRHANANRRAAK